MFERIIVPLDGSPSAEAALPAAQELARRLGSSIVLLHVIEARPPRLIHGERHIATEEEAEAYLAPIARRLTEAGLSMRSHVHVHVHGARRVAAEVAAHESEFGNDLAVMVAHGRRGLADILAGSLPLKVAAAGGASVLLVAPESAHDPAVFAPARILAPLDGRQDHEAALPAAALLAKTFAVGLELISGVPRRGSEAGGAGSVLQRLSPALSGASLEYAAEGAQAYLAETAQRLSVEGIATTWSLKRGKPARAILAGAEPDDLIVMSTHRRLGLDASLEGCVAFGVAGKWAGNMLLVPIGREGQT